MRYVTLWKDIGQTPLQAIEAWKRENPSYADTPASYAGRLDPMAEGRLLVLLGDECKRQKGYHGLDKEYEIEIVLDLATDTGDALGMPTYAETETRPSEHDVQSALHAETGARLVPYPAFSSKTVNGKPLFLYALEGALDTVDIPVHEERIRIIRLLGSETVTGAGLRARIARFLLKAPRVLEASKRLGADFRQDAVRDAWESLLDPLGSRSFLILRLRVTCGSGAYMRSLAGRIGSGLGTKAFALSIRRTRIGRYVPLAFGGGLWTKRY